MDRGVWSGVRTLALGVKESRWTLPSPRCPGPEIERPEMTWRRALPLTLSPVPPSLSPGPAEEGVVCQQSRGGARRKTSALMSTQRAAGDELPAQAGARKPGPRAACAAAPLAGVPACLAAKSHAFCHYGGRRGGGRAQRRRLGG